MQDLSVQALSPSFWILGTSGLLGSLLVLAGIIGLYLWIAESSSWWGFAAFAAAFTGTGLGLGMNWAYAFAMPDLARMDPVYVDSNFPGSLGSGVALAVSFGLLSWVLLGAAAYFARNFPRWPSLVLGASILLLSLPMLNRTTPLMAVLINVLLAAGPLAYGSALWRLAGDHREPGDRL